MASLRARLIVGVLAVAAVGLLLLAGITYFAQRSFQYNRVDAQTRSSYGRRSDRPRPAQIATDS